MSPVLGKEECLFCLALEGSCQRGPGLSGQENVRLNPRHSPSPSFPGYICDLFLSGENVGYSFRRQRIYFSGIPVGRLRTALRLPSQDLLLLCGLHWSSVFIFEEVLVVSQMRSLGIFVPYSVLLSVLGSLYER